MGKASWFEWTVATEWAELTFHAQQRRARGRYADAVATFTAVGFPCEPDTDLGQARQISE